MKDQRKSKGEADDEAEEEVQSEEEKTAEGESKPISEKKQVVEEKVETHTAPDILGTLNDILTRVTKIEDHHVQLEQLYEGRKETKNEEEQTDTQPAKEENVAKPRGKRTFRLWRTI